MSRDRLRDAVQHAVDQLYAALKAELRDELLAELRRELGSAAPIATSPAPAAKAPRPSAVEKLAAKIVAWVAEHPRSTPGAVEKAMGGNRKALYQALAHARDAGELVREGNRPRVWYSTPGAAAPPPAVAPATSPDPAPSTVTDRVVAFVLEHPAGCTPKDMASLGASRSSLFQALAAAVGKGLVRKAGHSRGVVYLPPAAQGEADEAAAPSPVKPPPASLRGQALVDAVVAYVREHPECRYGDIEKATDASKGRLTIAIHDARTAGAIRMEGAKIKSRYFPVEGKAPPRAATIPPVPVVARARTMPPPPAPVPAPTPRAPALDASIVAAADAALRELDGALDDGSHDIRLGALLQAIVAEVRQLQERVPDAHPLARRLDGTIRRITAIRAERNLPFIVGLKRGATGDWARLSRDARRRVAKFDEDAEALAPQRREPRPKANGSSSKSSVEIERLPRLAALAAEKSIVLVGGIKKNEVLEQARRHFALDLEWAAMQGANARAADAVVDRIRHGNVGAVVVLEALTGTTQVKSVVAACKDAGVPFAYGGSAGTESLRSALREIERNADG